MLMLSDVDYFVDTVMCRRQYVSQFPADALCRLHACYAVAYIISTTSTANVQTNDAIVTAFTRNQVAIK